MNISFTKAFVANGKTYATLDEAKLAALERFFSSTVEENVPWAAPQIAGTILGNSEAIQDILSTTEKSHPAGRKINGATRRRKKNEPSAVNAALQDQDA